MTSSPTLYIDRIYDRFVARLPLSLVPAARSLPVTLGLSLLPDEHWSTVFDDRMLLELPLVLLGESDRVIAERTLEWSAVAHLLAMIGTRCIDRLYGPGPTDGRLERLLSEVSWAHEGAASHLRRGEEQPMSFARATEDVTEAIAYEREVLAGRRAPSWTGYQRVSLERHALALPACMLAARAAGWSGEDQRLVREVIAGVVLGLRYRRDAACWIDDHEHGVAWAVALAGCARIRELRSVGETLHEGRILVRMLEVSRDELRRAAEAARALGALEVAEWATQQSKLSEQLALDELRNPGAAVRWELERRFTQVERSAADLAA